MTLLDQTETPATPAVADVHPLEPLTAQEISLAAAILRSEQGLTEDARFVFTSLHEPPKDAVRSWAPGAPVAREAHVVLHDRASGDTIEAVVSLSAKVVLSFTAIPDVQAAITGEEFLTTEELVRADPRWQEAMRARGIEDLSLAMLDPWASSYTKPEDAPGARRICRPLTWLRAHPRDNGYARPVEGLVVTVDMDRMEVVEVEDHGIVPLPTTSGNYEPDLMVQEGNVPAFSGERTDVLPIEITQPEGSSFTVEGHHVRWQKWDLRVGFNPREGLTLHQVGYEDGGRLRPVVYRASLSEMWVPYGDPGPTHAFKNVFDMGEYGVGVMANPLELGCDCLGDITYLDGLVNDQEGEPVTITNAICMHEEDAGIGWKHTDFRTGHAEVRRLRRLVISMIATVGNYEYGYYWYLQTDGTIEYEVKLTGVLSTGAYDPEGPDPEYGVKLAPGLYGPHHQHFFCVRLDMEVDSERNRVTEVDSRPVPMGPENPNGTAWKTHKTVLSTESEAQRLVDPLAGRYWRIESSETTNHVGDPCAYKLMPGDNVLPMLDPDGQFGRRGLFAFKHLWVTPFAAEEQFAAGPYPLQHPGGAGLPEFTKDDRAVVDEDLVVWYSFGAHHVVRPEDWPVMPVAHIGFALKPSGFFDGNPALDMPATAAAAHCDHHGHG